MRIIWFAPGFPANENDTEAVPYLQKLALEISKIADLHIIALEYPFSNKAYHWNGIPVYPCNGQNKRWAKWRTAFRVWRITRQLSQGQKELVFHSFWLGWAAELAEYMYGMLKHGFPFQVGRPNSSVLHVCTLMGQDARPSNLGRLLGLGKRMEGRLAVLSDFHNKTLFDTASFSVKSIIPFGIVAEEVLQVFAEERSIDILGIGGLNDVKNWDKWLQIVAIVAAEKPLVQATLIGKGPQKNHLLARAQQLGIAHLLHIRDDLSRPEALKYMQNSKVMLHSADFESLGYVFVEAAAQGCRIVSTPVGIAETFADCAQEIEELAQKVVAALLLPPLKMPFVPYRMEDTAKAYIDLFKAKSHMAYKPEGL